ncbi:hypothetical protein OV203_31605 [Nannocystis sp. ILAH1]|uniref:hypothetical protein n=1 Tax=unclassified Nannocystis TaxID=2627009 RepID=UPI002271E9D6|nr:MULTISPECIES: hypothetical protein [unclassified Nannocystis]MCY0991731.1 hypothetical protein [Nannocystis sp. ILAH1]MCY1067279.1 hypothetical protein [Nannocystis sp. RBIL2]
MNLLFATFEGSPNKKETAMSRIPLIFMIPLLSAALPLDVNAKDAATGVVRGHGEVPSTEEGALLPSQISINAWLDSEGAHGRIIWIGDFAFVPGDPQDKGGPADPWIIDVTSLTFLSDNSAEVCGVVVHAPREEALEEEEGCLVFTDNRDTGEADTIDGVAINAGNILVK